MKIEKKKMTTEEENKMVEEMYTTLSKAKREIKKRWKDKKLKRKVKKYLGEVPEAFKNKPKAAIFRFVATPNLEFQLASESAEMAKLEMIFMEFLQDKFCTRNLDKVHLGKLKFFKNGKGRKNVVAKEKIIDLEKSEGIRFKNIKTIKGEKLIDFHHRIFFEKYPKVSCFDVSMFKINGETPLEVYLKVFALFITNGILFENYFINTNKDEREFTLKVVHPAFEKIKEIFGTKPLIVPLISVREDGESSWQYYPIDLKEKLYKK